MLKLLRAWNLGWLVKVMRVIRFVGLKLIRHYYVSYCLGFLMGMFSQKKAHVIRCLPGTRQEGSTNRLCLFAHFDRHDRVDDYVVHLLANLADIGCDVVLASACRSLPAQDLERIRPYCVQILQRDNVGHDFGSWNHAIKSVHNLSAYDEVILANDSVYGPLFDLKTVFASMKDRPVDIWGITDSYEPRHHLQSYFLVIRRLAIESTFFDAFWSGFRYLSYKPAVVARFEVGLSRQALRAGLRIGAYCNYWQVRQSLLRQQPGTLDPRIVRRKILNPTHFFWKSLVTNHGCPFLKVELLRDNPVNMRDVQDWENVIRCHTHYNTDLIKNHLARLTALSVVREKRAC